MQQEQADVGKAHHLRLTKRDKIKMIKNDLVIHMRGIKMC